MSPSCFIIIFCVARFPFSSRWDTSGFTKRKRVNTRTFFHLIFRNDITRDNYTSRFYWSRKSETKFNKLLSTLLLSFLNLFSKNVPRKYWNSAYVYKVTLLFHFSKESNNNWTYNPKIFDDTIKYIKFVKNICEQTQK